MKYKSLTKVLASDSWDKMTYEQQKKYLEDHPKSKKKITRKKGDNKRGAAGEKPTSTKDALKNASGKKSAVKKGAEKAPRQRATPAERKGKLKVSLKKAEDRAKYLDLTESFVYDQISVWEGAKGKLKSPDLKSRVGESIDRLKDRLGRLGESIDRNDDRIDKIKYRMSETANSKELLNKISDAKTMSEARLAITELRDKYNSAIMKYVSEKRRERIKEGKPRVQERKAKQKARIKKLTTRFAQVKAGGTGKPAAKKAASKPAAKAPAKPKATPKSKPAAPKAPRKKASKEDMKEALKDVPVSKEIKKKKLKPRALRDNPFIAE